MKDRSNPSRSTKRSALVAGAVTLALAAGPASAQAEQVLTERAGDDPAQQPPQVVDPPSDRATTPTPAPVATTSQQASTDGDSDGGLIVGLSLATVALLSGGTLVVRRRRVAPGH
jgi:hypothetical protein